MFLSVSLKPSHGARQTLVTWTVEAELKFADFYVYSSPDGHGDWKLLNSDPASGTQFLDEEFVVTNRVSVPHYRVVAERPDEEDVLSPIVGLYDTLTRKEKGGINAILKLEYRQLRREGVPIFICVPKSRGTLAKTVDGLSNQEVGADCPEGLEDEYGYGQKYQGGYRRPIQSVMVIREKGPLIIRSKEGLNAQDQHQIQVRLLGVPWVKKGDLIVQPANDDRFVIGDVTKPHCFRGIFPVAWDAKIELLRRSDPAYKFPVPELLPV